MRRRALPLAAFVFVFVAGAFASWLTGRATTDDGANVILISLDTL